MSEIVRTGTTTDRVQRARLAALARMAHRNANIRRALENHDAERWRMRVLVSGSIGVPFGALAGFIVGDWIGAIVGAWVGFGVGTLVRLMTTRRGQNLRDIRYLDDAYNRQVAGITGAPIDALYSRIDKLAQSDVDAAARAWTAGLVELAAKERRLSSQAKKDRAQAKSDAKAAAKSAKSANNEKGQPR